MTSLGFPVFSRVTSEDEVHRLRQRMIHTITLILFPLLTALAIVAPKFVTWFYGPAWRAAVVPVQILTIGGAAMLVAQAVTVAMLATGRARAVMWWGWGHFLAYGAAVFAVARLGLTAVAVAAVVVHTTFLIISYLLLVRGSLAPSVQDARQGRSSRRSLLRRARWPSRCRSACSRRRWAFPCSPICSSSPLPAARAISSAYAFGSRTNSVTSVSSRGACCPCACIACSVGSSCGRSLSQRPSAASH